MAFYLSDIPAALFGKRCKTFDNKKSLYDNFHSMCSLSLLKPDSEETKTLICNLKNINLNYHKPPNTVDAGDLQTDQVSLLNARISVEAWLQQRDPNFTINQQARKGFSKNKKPLTIQEGVLSSRVEAVWKFFDGLQALQTEISQKVRNSYRLQ